MRHDTQFSVVCLGTGKGASMVYDGNCSPGYVLCIDNHPVILFGAGYGVTRQCLRYFGVIPLNIFIFSNRSHMSAELPVIIAVESCKGRRLRIVASEAVMSCIWEHRLAEIHSRIKDFKADNRDGVCDFVAIPSSGIPPDLNLPPYHLPGVAAVSLLVFDTSAAEASCGVCVLQNGHPLVVLTGDCAYNPGLHCAILRMAPVAILDGRRNASRDHASFTDILRAVENCGVVPRRVFIGQYGQPWEAPPVVKDGIVFPIVEGAVVVLGERLVVSRVSMPSAVEKEAENTDKRDEVEVQPTALTRSRHADPCAHAEVRPVKVFIINNESPDTPPAILMVQQLRNMTQVKQRVSELLHLRPVGALFSAETGQRLTSLSQFTHGMRVVATKIGGRPLEDLPAPRLNERQQVVVVPEKPLEGDSSLSVEMREYMQRAHQALRGRVGYEGLVSVDPATPHDNGVGVVSSVGGPSAGINSQSQIRVALSPETPHVMEDVGVAGREKSSRGGTAYSLRFTTLGA
ncbi:hypothetical protein MOQ_001431 [Trypanosoma cruzi marinkellei]|uniref:Uncharacterized protein n=1 Tax=Trypanosoma cruzi marinkellei TaxID=85056 RepID=K2NKT0_TRYCR|nr:hypothetical protein MOQ_001431 [Trypanosoma cruzi marinkellei]